MNYELGVLFFKCLLNCAYHVKVLCVFLVVNWNLIVHCESISKDEKYLCFKKCVFLKIYLLILSWELTLLGTYVRVRKPSFVLLRQRRYHSDCIIS